MNRLFNRPQSVVMEQKDESVQQAPTPSVSSIVRLDGSRASTCLLLQKSPSIAKPDESTAVAPLERSPSPMLDGRTRPIPRAIQLRRSLSSNGRWDGCLKKSPLGRSPFGKSFSELELERMMEAEHWDAEVYTSRSWLTVTTGSPERRSRSRQEVEVVTAGSNERRSPSRKEMEEIIEKESRNTGEYTSLSTLVKYTRSDSIHAERPLLRDTVLEKAATVYLRASWSMDSRHQQCGFWQSVCRALCRVVPLSCLGLSTTVISDPEHY